MVYGRRDILPANRGSREMADLFEAFLPKPDIYIDDMPATIFNGLLFDVQKEDDWLSLANKIIRQHVHAADRRNRTDDMGKS